MPKDMHGLDTIIIPFTETFNGKESPNLDKIAEHFKDFKEFGVKFSTTMVCSSNGKVIEFFHHNYE
jgi:hypothetical protein